MVIVATAATAAVRRHVLPATAVTVAIAVIVATEVIAAIAADVPQIRLRVAAAMAAVVRGLLPFALLRQPRLPQPAA